MKIAYLGIPTQNGNYTHYKYLKNGLPDDQLNLIALGRLSPDLILEEEDTFIHLGAALDRKSSQKELAFLLKDFLEQNEYSVLFPMNSPIATSIIPFLGEKIKVVQFLNNDNQRVYKYATSHLDYVSDIICVSKKQIQEIKKRVSQSFFDNHTHLIPYGITYIERKDRKFENKVLRIGFLGRMHQAQKNIFFLPEILKGLNIPYEFEMIGDGDDKPELINRLNAAGIKYKDWGLVKNEKINAVIENWDLFLFPSFFEGLGIVLIECMNNGTVPIANRIAGVTDFVVTDNHDGFIIDNNNLRAYINKIHQLDADRGLLTKIRLNAITTVKNRFNVVDKVNETKAVLIESQHSSKKSPPNLAEWKPYVEYKPSIITRVVNKVSKIFK